MDVNKIVKMIDEAGNSTPSIFKGSRKFYVTGRKAVFEMSGEIVVIIEIGFPLFRANDHKDAPQTTLALHYQDSFPIRTTEETIALTVIGYANQYADHYVRPVAELMQELNTGKYFNKPRGWTG